MRETTRAGRRIRHVAPGHVVDVATGQRLYKQNIRPGGPPPYRTISLWWGVPYGKAVCAPLCRQDEMPKQRTLDRMLPLVAIAAGICALVRWLAELGQAE